MEFIHPIEGDRISIHTRQTEQGENCEYFK